MTKLKQSLDMGQGRIVGLKSAPVVGVAIGLLSFLVHLIAAPLTLAQAQNGITDPEDGAALSGIVSIRGTATHDQFLRYELAFSTGADWLVFAEGDSPVVDGTLAIWDTTIGQPASPVFPDGVYHLRLRVVRQDYNYDEYFVSNLMINNAMTPTPTATATLETATTRALGTPPPQPSATSGFIIIRPTPLPSLTPFPTPSLPVVPGAVAGATPAAPDTNTAARDRGLLQRLLAIEADRFGRAFWAGAQLSMLAFVLLALYIVLRAFFRFLWPRLWAWINRQE